MATKDTPKSWGFDVNSAVVFRLGEELITDEVQALVELVKNSYDADATWVKVTIDTSSLNAWGRKYADATGVILVEDDGHGMDERAIQLGWLTIANSPKRAQKIAGRLTARGRTPIGDKGLGRLGSQRLARNVEIVTCALSEPATEDYVAFSWGDFRETSNLRDVPLETERREVSEKRHGTKLILSGLRDPDTWKEQRYLQDLQTKLSAMISPFQEARDFRVHLEVDGKRLELAEIAQRIRDTALLKYTVAFGDGVFEISGLARLNYLQPSKRDDRQLLKTLCQADQGRALYEFLAKKTAKGRPAHFELAQEGGWFVEFGTQIALASLDRIRRKDGVAVDPGPFRGEVDAVSLDRSDFKSHAFDRQSDYRNLVRELAGIRVYRDGFGVRVGEDWLGLGQQWTGGSSYYGLRPGNVLGYVAISAGGNSGLVETTSREGFQVNSHYQNFYRLLSEFVRFAGNFQEFLRRGVLQFLNEHRDRDAGVGPDEEHSRLTQRIQVVAGRLSAEKARVERHAESLGKATTDASRALLEVRAEAERGEVQEKPLSSAFRRLEGELTVISVVAAEAQQMLAEVSATLDEAAELKSLKEVLDRRWETLEGEVSALYESVSLGLTAEALSHEIHNIADRLARKSATLLRELNKGARKASVVAYIEHVRSSVVAMRKQLAHLTPSLRYLREGRERIEVVEWATEVGCILQ